ncbi:1-acyl-sn-glycerol-3-phosphate acyltransferase [Georgenia sp. Z1344]|uniref:1-acyl-sn-glycerol-3-phosphate acyltransferase n=1 Tax=Georgenia sp. Z1344 TaxID=3416706 RepID=UPI003CEC4314
MSAPRMLRRALGKALLAAVRYRLVAPDVREPRAIFIGAPHTARLDFVLMLGIAWSRDLTPKVLMKREYFDGIAGPFFRALGGIAVDRGNPDGLVADLVARAERGERFHLVITPEGTRGRREHWKSGFYRIALAADLPVVLGFLDSVTRTTGLGPTIRLTGDVRADMDRFRAFYADKVGVHPELGTPPSLADEETATYADPATAPAG